MFGVAICGSSPTSARVSVRFHVLELLLPLRTTESEGVRRTGADAQAPLEYSLCTRYYLASFRLNQPNPLCSNLLHDLVRNIGWDQFCDFAASNKLHLRY